MNIMKECQINRKRNAQCLLERTVFYQDGFCCMKLFGNSYYETDFTTVGLLMERINTKVRIKMLT